MHALNRAEQALEADLPKYLPLWKLAVPPEFENVHAWDFTKFGRGERFINEALPREDFDTVFNMVQRWGLDDFLNDRSPELFILSRGVIVSADAAPLASRAGPDIFLRPHSAPSR